MSTTSGQPHSTQNKNASEKHRPCPCWPGPRPRPPPRPDLSRPFRSTGRTRTTLSTHADTPNRTARKRRVPQTLPSPPDCHCAITLHGANLSSRQKPPIFHRGPKHCRACAHRVAAVRAVALVAPLVAVEEDPAPRAPLAVRDLPLQTREISRRLGCVRRAAAGATNNPQGFTNERLQDSIARG
jgi:hypothetical protein